MKTKFTLTVAGAAALAVMVASADPTRLLAAGAQAAAAVRTPVVIELFTSEGCSSCPPVDGFLSELEAKQPIPGVEIIALEEHVDYWNHDGWLDPFSGPEWTQRQQEYVAKFKGETPYTPQMILNGEKVMALKSGAEVQENIARAAKEERTEVSVEKSGADNNDAPKFEVHIGNLRATSEDKADVWMAVTEDGLHSDVKAGENKGKTLEHASIVRSLQKIGTASAKAGTPFAANPQVKLKSNWKKENLRVVVFVQGRKSWKILGAAAAKVS